MTAGVTWRWCLSMYRANGWIPRMQKKSKNLSHLFISDKSKNKKQKLNTVLYLLSFPPTAGIGKTMTSIYQVHFSVENIGKRQEESKKRAKWVYQVDGNNHEIEFLWSVRSGKQNVTKDGQQVLFNKKKGRSVFDEILTQMGEKPELRLVCARKAPNKAHPSFQCYELLIDDKPFGRYPHLNGENRESSGCVDASTTTTMEVNPDIVNTDEAVVWEDEPMSILDILFPGKYGKAPTKKLKLEEDMSFPEEDQVMVVSPEQERKPFITHMDADPTMAEQTDLLG